MGPVGFCGNLERLETSSVKIKDGQYIRLVAYQLFARNGFLYVKLAESPAYTKLFIGPPLAWERGLSRAAWRGRGAGRGAGRTAAVAVFVNIDRLMVRTWSGERKQISRKMCHKLSGMMTYTRSICHRYWTARRAGDRPPGGAAL